MARWQYRALMIGLSLVVAILLIEAGMVAFMLLGAFILIGIGFFVGWTARGDYEIAQCIFNLQPPPDDEPPERTRV